MGKKKIIIWAVIIIVLGGALFFGFEKFSSAKKVSVVPSIADIATNDNQQSANQSSGQQQPLQTADNLATPENKNTNVSNNNTSSTSNNTQTNSTTSTITKPIAGIVSRLASWGFQKSSGRTIKAIIIHTSYNNFGGDVFDFSKV